MCKINNRLAKITEKLGQWLILALCAGAISSSALLAEDWDIENTGQPFTEVDITLSEGTWMSVDVSPDGTSLVFDLLGDLFIMPASGGEARLLTGGAAIDRTPSFSPDGTQILYLSDRSGDDDVWVINIDGTGAKPLTHSTSTMLANPAWTPDGTYFAVASVDKGFRTQKTSELRLFHRAGGSGETLVPAPENKRDIQEPEFSSDGTYLYYTKRLVDHHIFVNANHVNYGILRKNLHTGETETLIKGFGGALTPQLSPNDKRLAFVRRVKQKTVLFVYNLETGEQRPVYDALDRDQQADFYLQGVYYPQYDWFPDNVHVAIWGKGKLFKVNMNTGAVVEIPFNAKATHRLTKTTRFSDPLSPEQVDVKAIRNVVVSPDNKQVLFHALGYLWQKSLPSGAPKRISKGSAFEFEPSFSADGKHIVYVEWDDEKGGALKVMALRNHKSKTLYASSGSIRQPAFSPDSKQLVFTVDNGSNGMGGFRATAGLYTVAAKGGAATRIGAAASAPYFSGTGERIFFIRRASKASTGRVTTLSSITVGGYDKQDHVQAVGPDRLEVKISPDGNWITFKEEGQYYVMPYRETGLLTSVSATAGSMPVTALTEGSGYNLGWSSDSQYIHWTRGDEFYRVAVAALPKKNEAFPKPITRFGLQVPVDTPEGAVAFVGGQVITMEGDTVYAKGTVVVQGNRILAVGAEGDVSVPKNATVIDTTGKTVMPGLIDMHGHIDCCYYGGLMPQKHSSHYAAAAFGITTNYDPYTSEISAYAATEMLQAGMLVGPRFISTGKVIYGRKGKGDVTYVPLNTYADAQNTMSRKRALGGRVIKSYKQPSRRSRQQLVKAGREAGVMVDVEGESQFYHNLSSILDGHMALEHNIPVATYYNDIVQLFAHSGAANTPTLNVTFGEIMGENYLYQTSRAWEDPKIKAYVQESTSGYSAIRTPYSAPVHVRAMATLHLADEMWDVGFRAVSRSTKKLDDAGVLVNSGSHGQVFGLALHWEMQSMAQGGMAPHRILRTATINGAKTLGVEDQTGSLKVGKLADIIVLDKNPLENISNSNSVRYTMINGRLYDSLSMNEVGNYDQPRTKFYWEQEDYNGIDWNEAWSDQ